jgi:hypothetical protein
MIERSGDVVCGLHHIRGDGERGSLGLASKSRSTICRWFGLKTTGMVYQWFGLKTNGTVFSGLASKPMVMVFSGFASKPVTTVFSGLASKSVATVSPSLASKPVVGFLVEPQNQDGGGFSSLGLKTGSYGLVICASKSPRWFLDLGIKTKRATVCRLWHKTDGRMKTVRDTRQDLAACFAWKQVGQGFPSLASRLEET